MNITLDSIDKSIVRILQEDGSLSIADLAERIGMTAPPCWRRVKRLKESGVLERQVWRVSPEAIGLTVIIYATVKLVAHDVQATVAFQEQIRKLPEVLECYILLGSIDVLLKIAAKDIKSYEGIFYKKLSQLPGVREINSSVVMSHVKNSLVLPLE